MFPGGKISPKQLKQMEKKMKQMGMNMKELEGVEQVVITLKDKEIVIKDAEVSIMKAMGTETYQISGNAEERIKGADTEDASEVEISEDDIDLVASQTGKSKEEAENALKEANGDLAEAIMRLS
ncbi:nascent polypeptide-associated complex protein [Methanosphaera sp.]|uniref:nascent polypeptide-associated complex protein n=1 Tax=Methanosphaera sp. TaxID=2666342 RepID=UPI0025F7229C|nr:nascent polypeptide-associated complex protein [Methanosphaera sp.]MEE1117487.1 nascent polypeptide-associated complex protein [Methanosphaera sp.]MEE3324063.1 nascent polypeptide-associated complex protein [Methanosphaera sp.]MEE3418788.1 nascent polypeptide-associated complex protein [Methanosphaera sp.]